ncbi:MAG: maltotransferase domain-containing protein [Planctomycetia bacterium]|nr:maltotransferase domain-containing protein [Planctomycetia bacterium]
MKRLDNYSSDGRSRVLIEAVSPRVDDGRFPVKRVVGDVVEVRARIFTDGHDLIQARLRFRHEDEAKWTECSMSPESNDWWNGRFEVGRLGAYRFSIEAWIDRFGSWRRDLMKRLNAEQPVDVELLQAHERSDEHHRDSGQP